MKKNIILFVVSACVLSLAGCSSTRPEVDTGSISARTFSFINTQGKATPEFAEQRQQVHSLFQGAITQGLARRQVSRVEQGGDVTVAYLIIAGNNVVTTSINDYFGYGRDSAKLADIAHTKYTNNKNPNYYEAGTLLIDIIDSKSWKVLYRGHATRAVQKNISAEAQAVRVNEVVEEILAGVRFRQ